jgi:hypothetical protein
LDGNVGKSLDLSYLKDLGDVRMVETSRESCLSFQKLSRSMVIGVAQKFERNKALEVRLVGAMDAPHGSASRLFQEVKLSEEVTGKRTAFRRDESSEPTDGAQGGKIVWIFHGHSGRKR